MIYGKVTRMFFQRLATTVSVLAPAKVNLFLELRRKRDDGFHELETVMVAVSLFDRLEFTRQSQPEILLETKWQPGQIAQAKQLGDPETLLGDLPTTEKNLVYRAACLLKQRHGVSQGASIRLLKRIPSASGFGGASSDAAATLLAANQAWGLQLSLDQLTEVAAELGSDVPFFLHSGQMGSGQAVATGRGEKIEAISGKRLFLVLVRPNGGLSTAEIYRRCRVPKQPDSAEQLLQYLNDARHTRLPTKLTNRLADPAFEVAPKIGEIEQFANRLGDVVHQMSGSGSGYFFVCRNQLHSRQVAARLNAARLGMVFPVTTCGMRPLRF